jgi:hypothetical protein
MSNRKEIELNLGTEPIKPLAQGYKHRTNENQGPYAKVDRIGSKTAPIEEDIVIIFLLI